MLTRQQSKSFILSFWQLTEDININQTQLTQSAFGCISHYHLTGKKCGQRWLKMRSLKHPGGLADYMHAVWQLHLRLNSGRDLCCSSRSMFPVISEKTHKNLLPKRLITKRFNRIFNKRFVSLGAQLAGVFQQPGSKTSNQSSILLCNDVASLLVTILHLHSFHLHAFIFVFIFCRRRLSAPAMTRFPHRDDLIKLNLIISNLIQSVIYNATIYYFRITARRLF